MDIFDLIKKHPDGISPLKLERELAQAGTLISRATINRQLRSLISQGVIASKGEGAARVYIDADPLASIRTYFERPHTQRPFAKYREELLEIDPEFTIANWKTDFDWSPLERKDMVRFLVDFACASSALEGGTYSTLDTQALIQYGERAPDKPLSDAYLVLNHKNAFEYLFDHPTLDLETIKAIHKRLTSDHGQAELRAAPHFLDADRAGEVREYQDVNIASTTYSPPTRPGTRYIERMLQAILNRANSIQDPLQAAFYLLTRVPYLQPFADGNKRTSRAICNIPLLNAGMPPLSFMDFSKRDYILSILSFYELGNIEMSKKCFTDAYFASCDRLGLTPAQRINCALR